MPTRPSLSIPEPVKAQSLVLACLVVAAAVATACGEEKETFTGEPVGAIAFASDRDGTSDIYRMSGDGSDPENLTNDEAQDSEPSWSPDGSRLAFSSLRSGAADLFVMSADGSDVQRLTDDPAVDGGARWSSDGSRIAFYSFREQDKGLMWVMDAEGSEPEPVLEEQTPSPPQTTCAGGFPGGWFPDDQRILYRGSQGAAGALQICSVAPDGSDTKVILSENGVQSYSPTLSPDGRKIAFASGRDGNAEIYVMNADGGDLRRLTDDAGIDDHPTWSPDGQWIAFHSNRDGDFDIYIVRPDGSDLRQLTDNDDDDQQPSWSPG